MAKAGGVTHLFAELSSLDDLNSLLGRSARLKYTCLSVCRKFLALGSNSGGVYIFSRDTLKYLQVVFGDTEASLVVSVSLSPSDQHVAIALSTGHVAVFELNIDRRIKPERVRYTQDHTGHIVTALAWDAASARVFVGDNTGKISTIFIPNKGKSLFASPSEVIAYVESSVYQMEWWKDKLLVSTLTHTHLFDTVRQNYCTIGTKSRQGEYGSCFYMEPNSKATVIYCARPGSRMWEVGSDGKVLNTHQLKQLLAVAPTPVIRLGNEQFDFSNVPQAGHSVNFCKMFHISQFIITWSSKGLYLFDPINVKVMIWTQSFQGIKDMSVYNNDVYLFLEGGSIHRVTLLPIYQLFIVLCNRGLWTLSSSLLLAADQVGVRLAVMKKVKRDLLKDILAGLKSQGKDAIVEKVKAFMEDVSEGSVESVEAINDFMDSIEVKGHTYLPSGMVIVSGGVAVTQPWEKKPLEKVNSLGAEDMNNVQTRSCLDPDDIELQRSNTHIESYSVTESPVEGKQKEECNNEQIENSGVINLDKAEEDRIPPSGPVSEWAISEQFSAKDSKWESGNAQKENFNLWNNSDQEHVVELDNSMLQSENCLLPATHIAQDIIPSSDSQMYDNQSQLLCDDMTIDSSLDKNSSYAAEIALMASQVQKVDNVADESLYQCAILDNVNESNDFQNVNSMFIENSSMQVKATEGISERDVTFNFVTERRFSANSESFPCTLERRTSAQEGASDLSFSEGDTYLVKPQSSTHKDIIDDQSSTHKDIIDDQSSTHKDFIDDQSSTHKDIIDDSYSTEYLSCISSENTLDENSTIAQPVRVSKKRRKRNEENVLRSLSPVLLTTVSVGDDLEDQFMQGLDIEMDSISIATISSIEEESNVGSPDSGSIAGDVEAAEPVAGHKFSPELSSLMPPELLGKKRNIVYFSRCCFKFNNFSFHGERRYEVIPPLIDRLNAAHRSASSDDMLASLHQDSPSGSPLSMSSENFLPVGSSRASLTAFKDGLSLKLKTQTKSLIKTFKEKNPLTKSSNSAAISVISPLQLERSAKDGINSQAPNGDQPDGFAEIDKTARFKSLAASAAKTPGLYVFALDIQKMLNDWAVELNSALSRYHEELVKRKNEEQLHEERLLSHELENGGNNENTDASHEVNNEKHLVLKTHNGVVVDDSSLITSQGNHNMTSDISVAASSESNIKFTQSPDLSHLEYVNLTPTYWADVVHCDDPFHLPSKHLDLFRTLTTMCFVSGVTGDILQHFNFTDEVHLRSFAQAILPPSVYELFSPDCTCLMSLFPDQHISCDHDLHQHKRNVSEGMKNGKQSQPPGALVQNAAGTSPKVADVSPIHVQEFDNSSLSSSVSIHETKKKISPGPVNKLKLCYCQRSSVSWSENEQLKQDVSMALFIRHFFFALDYEKVKQVLEKQKSRMFIAWVSLVLCCREKGRGDIVSSILTEKQISSAIDYLRSGILPNQSALLGHIYSLFEMAAVKTSEFCGEIWETIKPADVIQLCCLCSKHPAAYLLRYFKQAMISLTTTARPAVFSQLCANRDVRCLLLQTILSPESNDGSADGISSLATQLKAVLPFDWLNSLLSLITSDDDRERIVQLCAKIGHPVVSVKLLSEANQWQKLLQLILDLNDITLLTGAHDGYIPKNEQEWKFLLRRFNNKWSDDKSAPAPAERVVYSQDSIAEEQSPHLDSSDSNLPVFSILDVDDGIEDSGAKAEDSKTAKEQINPASVEDAESRNSREDRLSLRYESFSTEHRHDLVVQDKSITWNSLGCLLLKHVGGAAAIDLLMEHLHDPLVAKNCLSAGFMKACYLDFIVKMEQNCVTHDILEKMSVYMWKKKPDYLPPPVVHAIKTEKLIKKGEGDDVAMQGLFSQVKALSSKDLMSENLGSQWGHEVIISSHCLCCHLPLKSVMSLTVQGVVIFPCGHAFHRCCASDTVCPLIH
ncbi:unnamed protein product [Candidula unifasciata]|uniref:RING-type domain-containing protein n=1 Tax=Candidula unifasciata TaxID=100452 RepID=A0A8S3ZKD3_9EUPU|nr:unnamed protein product [Candidula unifasciata]